ncbi:branched-chain amino acid ABC transporter permease/ATP-binding protein [Amycolatopsis sp. GM8]|uniref:branched-chain amino acid ABC transporter permease/ATP-binding protein n=1 Tax=Amycolatopsis sp. GM8 TaxID=2896530 RepID=UPI001F01D320|nr:branched-chain amino acid ABC transporter permease/ATP-binding protein [Amycolatopsis sp. GM8]
MLLFIIAGLATGSVYGLAGVGLVLTYKSAGIFNFAHGALATISAFLFYFLHVQNGVPWPLAAAACVLVAAPLLGVGLELLARPLARAGLATQVVATVGLLLTVQAAVVLIYGFGRNREVPQYLPSGSVTIAGAQTSWATLAIIAFGLVATTGLSIYFRRACGGVAMRAVVDDGDLVELAGTNSVVVRRRSWVLGSMLASVSGLLLAPLVSLDGITLTLLVIQAFGAAAVGRFRSLPATYAGGLVIGVLASLTAGYATGGIVARLPAALPFLVLFAVLVFRRRARVANGHSAGAVLTSAWRAPAVVQLGGACALLAVLVLVPQFADYHLGDWMTFLPMVILFLSLGLLVRTSGQVSLASVTFMAIGACAFSHLTVDKGWPWGFGLLAASAIAVPIGAVLALPAIRQSGLFLALATLGFGIAVSYVFYAEPYMFGTLGLGLTVPRPTLPGIGLLDDGGFYYLLLAIAVVLTIAVVVLTQGRLGRLLRAIADSPRGLASSGGSVNVTRVLVFCLSSFLAAFAGALAGSAQGLVTADNFQPLQSLVFFVVVIISIGETPWYAILAAAGVTVLPSYLSGSPETMIYLQLVFGVAAVLYSLLPAERRGVPPALRGWLDRLRLRRPHREASIVPAAEATRPNVAAARLEVVGLGVSFGGIVAVDGLELTAQTGTITALIGPNGAGKTTTFDVISGFTAPSQGAVRLDGRDLARLGPAARARLGLGRTHQRLELFDSMTVLDNVALGREASYADRNPLHHLIAGRRRRAQVAGSATAALEVCGIRHLATRRVADLSTGQRRLVEFARCLAGPFRILLLDEPSSGLDRIETARFAQVVRRVVAERGVGVLLVEHDMDLVVKMADHVYVLDFGKLVFSGSAAEMTQSDVVRAAYLGDELVAAS